MTIDLGLGLLISLLVPLILGYASLHMIMGGRSFPMILGLAISFGLGFGILSQWMLLLAIFQVPLGRLSISLPLLGLALIFLLMSRLFKQKTTPQRMPFPLDHASLPDKILGQTPLQKVASCIVIFYVLYQIVFLLWHTLELPIHTWDAIYVIAPKAKIFYYTGSVEKLKFLPLASYPLQVPFCLTWIALNVGAWDDQWVKIIFPLICLCFLLMYYFFLSKYTNHWWALLGIGLLMSSNFFIYHSTITYREIFLMYYIITSLFLIWIALSENNNRLLILAGIFAGFATFVKLEGLGYFFINLILLGICILHQRFSLREGIRKFLSFAIPAIFIFSIYYFYKISQNMSPMGGRFRFDFHLEHLSRMSLIFSTLGENLFLSGNWNILWFLLLVSLIYHWRRIKASFILKFFGLALVLYLGLYVFVSFLTPNFISISGIQSITVLSRILLPFFPLCPLLIIFLNYQKEFG